MVENLNDDNKEIDISHLITQLTNMESGSYDLDTPLNMETETFNEYENKIVTEAKNQDLNVFKCLINVSPECVMKAVRVFMVFKSLEEIGEIIKSVPNSQDLEDEKFENEFTVYLVSNKSTSEIEKIINNISEINLEKIELVGESLDNNETIEHSLE